MYVSAHILTASFKLGLKAQHVTAISWLAKVTGAEVDGLSVGSKTLSFIPKKSPTQLSQREFHIKADSSSASTLLVLQALTPYLLFAANDAGDPIILHIEGGTNVDWSLSYEYFDQVLAPTLEERFGLKIERHLDVRGWSLGPSSRGSITLKVHPVPKGQMIKYNPPKKNLSYPKSYDVASVDVNMITPSNTHSMLQSQLVKDIGAIYPDADVQFKVVEDSGSDARWSVLLVAHSVDGIRWGRDVLCSMPRNTKSRDSFVKKLSSSLCQALHGEVCLGGQVDEYLQDQVVMILALCEGYSSFPRGERPEHAESEAELDKLTLQGSRIRREQTHEPFGHGSSHTQTARWVVSQMLPKAEFYNKGDMVKGVGFSL